MLKGIIGAAAAMALAGCATVAADGGGGQAAGLQSISYETGRCFGACPVYRVTVNADGTGVFEGRRFTSVEGERAFTLTPDQFRAFAAQLAPVRPATGSVRYDPASCETVATDLPGVDIEWRDTGAAPQQLYFYYGCDMEKNRAIAERLQAAPKLLPIAEFILAPGARPFTGK